MADFTIGTVYLNVRQLQPILDWYQARLGLQIHWQEGKRAALGAGEHDLLVLTETPDYTRSRQHTGLFHFALLVPDRVQLAKSLTHLAQMQTQLQGMSDHAVSEALYLADPEGNGIEIYRDRPREAWYDKDSNFLLTTMHLDVADLLAELETANTWQGLPTGTIMGHIHLHVSDIPSAETVYTKHLGMDVMLN
ncbi:MAG: VOC family protein, partial [Chloroflexota bacterium]